MSWRDWLKRPPALTDVALQGAMAAAIEAAKVRHAVSEPGTVARWAPGQPLKLLLVGYLGTRNTGADVRVAEMIRQLQTILGPEQVELTVLTSDARLSAGYFPGVRQVWLPDLYPTFLLEEVKKHHGVVACEGSMFKSKFANALTTLMVGALGIAAAENKLSVGYGAEAGEMDPLLQALVKRYCGQSLIVCRNEASRDLLAELGIATEGGTDTAWTFDPGPPEPARDLLRAAGWDGERPVLAVCPINPFWWPVRPEPARSVWDTLSGRRSPTHYRSLYYHSYGEVDADRQASYLDALADGVGRFVAEEEVFPVVVGMERLDREACDALAERLGGLPRFVSDEHDMFTLVGVLRQCRYVASSRYHALVCSMPAGVPSIGVSMDERIDNLMDQRGQPELTLRVDDPHLGDRLLDGLRRLKRDAAAIRSGILAVVAREIQTMGTMGIAFEERVLARYPEFPRRDVPRTWRHYVPPLTPGLEVLLEPDSLPAPQVVP